MRSRLFWNCQSSSVTTIVKLDQEEDACKLGTWSLLTREERAGEADSASEEAVPAQCGRALTFCMRPMAGLCCNEKLSYIKNNSIEPSASSQL